jgi:hypothetical protein
MAKFYIYATETVRYLKVMEADNLESLKEMIDNDEVDITNAEIVDGDGYEITDIEEIAESELNDDATMPDGNLFC